MDVLEEPEEEGVLTAERVLCHAEAQGLQPVVDVRFSHRHLELCREKGQETLVRGPGRDPACHTPPARSAAAGVGAPGVGNHPQVPQEGLAAWPDSGSALLPGAITSSKRSLQK